MIAMNRSPILRLSFVLAAVLGLVFPTSASATSWTDPQLIAARTWDTAMFLSARGSDVAIAYADGSSTDISFWLRVRISTDRGSSFQPAVIVARRAMDAAVTVCGRWVVLAWSTNGGPRVARMPVGGGPLETVALPGADLPMGMALTCGAGRIWLVTSDSRSERVSLRHALRSSLDFSEPIDLGPGHVQAGAVAVVHDVAVMAWQTDTGLRLARALVGDGPGRPVTIEPSVALAPGATGPVLAADATDVVLGFSRGAHTRMRRSTDDGATFGSASVIGDDGRLTSLAIAGDSVATVVTVKQYRNYARMRSEDGGLTWTSTRMGDAEHQVGFVRTADGPRIADAWHRFWMWDDPSDLWFHRER